MIASQLHRENVAPDSILRSISSVSMPRQWNPRHTTNDLEKQLQRRILNATQLFRIFWCQVMKLRVLPIVTCLESPGMLLGRGCCEILESLGSALGRDPKTNMELAAFSIDLAANMAEPSFVTCFRCFNVESFSPSVG